MWALTDMELDDDDKLDMCAPICGVKETPDYPWGLRISLGESEMRKLEVENMPEVGEYVALRAVARVTSVSSNEIGGKPERRVELQIEQLGFVEDSDA